jgi:hypothetical protein
MFLYKKGYPLGFCGFVWNCGCFELHFFSVFIVFSSSKVVLDGQPDPTTLFCSSEEKKSDMVIPMEDGTTKFGRAPHIALLPPF